MQALTAQPVLNEVAPQQMYGTGYEKKTVGQEDTLLAGLERGFSEVANTEGTLSFGELLQQILAGNAEESQGELEENGTVILDPPLTEEGVLSDKAQSRFTADLMNSATIEDLQILDDSAVLSNPDGLVSDFVFESKDASVVFQTEQTSATEEMVLLPQSGQFEQTSETHSESLKKRKIGTAQDRDFDELAAYSIAVSEETPAMREKTVQADIQSAATHRNAHAQTVLPEISAITVDDRRTQPQKERGLSTAVIIDKNGEAQMNVTLSAQTPQQSAANADGLPVKNAQNFSHMLSQEIQSNASEFVKTGSIILRDNNAGTINMVLHPEELGNVKIHLELSDKVITGKITVESLEAFNAFKSNLQNLRTAFTESGFSSAGFELSWSGNNAGNSSGERGSHENRGEQNPNGHFYSEAMPVAISETEERTITYGFAAVNVMA